MKKVSTRKYCRMRPFFDHLRRIVGLFNENNRKNRPSWSICSRTLFFKTASQLTGGARIACRYGGRRSTRSLPHTTCSEASCSRFCIEAKAADMMAVPSSSENTHAAALRSSDRMGRSLPPSRTNSCDPSHRQTRTSWPLAPLLQLVWA